MNDNEYKECIKAIVNSNHLQSRDADKKQKTQCKTLFKSLTKHYSQGKDLSHLISHINQASTGNKSIHYNHYRQSVASDSNIQILNEQYPLHTHITWKQWIDIINKDNKKRLNIINVYSIIWTGKLSVGNLKNWEGGKDIQRALGNTYHCRLVMVFIYKNMGIWFVYDCNNDLKGNGLASMTMNYIKRPYKYEFLKGIKADQTTLDTHQGFSNQYFMVNQKQPNSSTIKSHQSLNSCFSLSWIIVPITIRWVINHYQQRLCKQIENIYQSKHSNPKFNTEFKASRNDFRILFGYRLHELMQCFIDDARDYVHIFSEHATDPQSYGRQARCKHTGSGGRKRQSKRKKQTATISPRKSTASVCKQTNKQRLSVPITLKAIGQLKKQKIKFKINDNL